MTSNSSQPSLRPKPLDALVAAVVIALAVVTALLFYLPKTGGGDQLGQVQVAREETTVLLHRQNLEAELSVSFELPEAWVLGTGAGGSRIVTVAGNGYEMTAIAACVLGGISLSGGLGNMVGAAIGAVWLLAMLL